LDDVGRLIDTYSDGRHSIYVLSFVQLFNQCPLLQLAAPSSILADIIAVVIDPNDLVLHEFSRAVIVV
jgi:hypothetical protein